MLIEQLLCGGKAAMEDATRKWAARIGLGANTIVAIASPYFSLITSSAKQEGMMYVFNQ